MPTYVEEYTDNEDEEVIIVPYVKPPPPMIVLSASEDEEEEELATPETNDKQSSKKASRSKKTISNEQRDTNVSNELPAHSMSKSNNEIGHKKSSIASKRSRISKTKKGSNQEQTTKPVTREDDPSEKYISIGVTSNEQKTVAESSQNVELSGDLIPVPSSNQNLSIGTNTPALSSRVVTDSMSVPSRGDSEMDRHVEEEVAIPRIHISTTIFESNVPLMECSVANKDLLGNATQHQAQDPSTIGKTNKTPKKRISSKTAREQSRSDLLKFIQHLGLPLQELPAIDTPVRRRNANATPSSRSKAKSGQTARATATSTSTNPSQAESESGGFVLTAEDIIADSWSILTKKKGRSGKTKQSEPVDKPEDNSFTRNQLETTCSELLTNAVVISDERTSQSTSSTSTPTFLKLNSTTTYSLPTTPCSSKATSKVTTPRSNKRKSNTSPNLTGKKLKIQTGQSPKFPGGSNASTDDILNKPLGIFPKKWGNNLRDFYGRVRDEDIQTEDILNKQSGQLKKWKTPEDKTRAKKRNDWRRCPICHQYGHMRSTCSEKNKPTVCFMCGREGHNCDNRSSSCPQGICLNCGTPKRAYQAACEMCIYRKPKAVQCKTCQVVGHTDKLCPDSWRRYHSTIEDPSTIDRVTEDILRLGLRDEALKEEIELAVQETQRVKNDLTSSRRRDLVEKSTRKELQLTEERKRVINQLNSKTRIYKKLQAKTERSRLESSIGGFAESQSKKIYKPLFAVYCSNCGVQGHTFFKCRVGRYNTICQPNKPYVVQELPSPVSPAVSNKTPTSLEASIERVVRADSSSSVGMLEVEIRNTSCSPRSVNQADHPSTQSQPNPPPTQLENPQPGSRVILLNEDEYTHLQKAIQENKTDVLFAKYKKRNISIDISQDSREFKLAGDEKGMDEARLDIFKMLIPLTSPRRASKAVSNVAKILQPDRKSSSDSGGAKTTSTRVRQPLITNEEVIEELDEIVPIPRTNSLKGKHQLPSGSISNQDFEKTSIPPPIPSPSVGIRNLGRETDFQEDELPNMFDIDERVMTSNEKLAATMKSMFDQQSPFYLSINSQKEFVPVLVPVPMAEYESYISGKLPVPDFISKFGVPPNQASAKCYYQNSLNFPELPQVLPTLFGTPSAKPVGQTLPKTESPGSKDVEQSDKMEEHEPTVPPQLRDASPDIEIIHEVAAQADSNGSGAEGSKSEPRKLNNLKNVEKIKLMPSQWLLFCDDKSDILKQITTALKVTISLSKSDLTISIRGRNPEKRRIAYRNILNFIQSKGGQKEFTLNLRRQSSNPRKGNRPSSANSLRSSSGRDPNGGRGSAETESDFPDYSMSRGSIDERRNDDNNYPGPAYSRYVPNPNHRTPRDDYTAHHSSYNDYFRHRYSQGSSSSYRGNRYYNNYNNRYSRGSYASGERYYSSNYNTRGRYNNN